MVRLELASGTYELPVGMRLAADVEREFGQTFLAVLNTFSTVAASGADLSDVDLCRFLAVVLKRAGAPESDLDAIYPGQGGGILALIIREMVEAQGRAEPGTRPPMATDLPSASVA